MEERDAFLWRHRALCICIEVCVCTHAHTPSLPAPYSQAVVGLLCKQRKSRVLSRTLLWKIAGLILFSVAHSSVLQWHHLIPPLDSRPVP